MTLDEAIAKHRKIAETQKALYDACVLKEQNKHFLREAEEHEQLAEWLELLKWYEQGMEDIPSESGVLPKDVYHAGYNKAIDDFVNACEQQFTTMYGQRYVDMRDIVNIAEQLKEVD